MFDLGWTELMVIGIVALIVVGPKDLPKMFRSLGQFTAKARSMAREFQRAMDDAADSTGVKDVARDLRKATDPQSMGLDEVNKMRNWDPLKDPEKKKKSSKADTGSGSTDTADDHEEAMDRISAEMENLRKERVRKTAAPAPSPKPATASKAKPATKAEPAAADPESQAPATPSDRPSDDTPDKSKA